MPQCPTHLAPLIALSDQPRDRAALSILIEAKLRPPEIVRLNIASYVPHVGKPKGYLLIPPVSKRGPGDGDGVTFEPMSALYRARWSANNRRVDLGRHATHAAARAAVIDFIRHEAPSRRVELTWSSTEVARYLSTHPFRERPDAPMFPTDLRRFPMLAAKRDDLERTRLNGKAVRNLVENAARRAEVDLHLVDIIGTDPIGRGRRKPRSTSRS